MIEKNIAEAYADRIWNKKDLTAIDEFFHLKGVIHSLLGDFYGPTAMKKVVQTWLAAFPNLVVKNIATINDKELVVLHWQAEGRQQGEFQGIKPSGKAISYAGVTIYHIQNAKIIEYWAYLNMQHLLEQLR